MPPQTLLIADDLTGACDAAVHFAARGHRTWASLDLEGSDTGCDVQALSTESRDFDCEAIAALWSRVGAIWGTRAGRVVIKKIDSTLRGSPGFEIEAAMGAFGCDAAVITPALPAMGRVVQEGRLRVLWDDGFRAIDVAQLLETQGLRGCVRCSSGAVGDALASGARAVVADAAEDRDLDRIVAQGLSFAGRLMWVGSAGMVSAIARALPAWGSTRVAERPAGPAIFCIGSDHKVTVEQVRCLAAARNVVSVLPAAEWREGGVHGLLQVPRGCDPAWIRDALTQAPAAPLLLTGGDTASLVLCALGARGIDLVDEIVPGLPRGVLRGGDFDGRGVATKSGGFGRPNALIKVADFFPCPNN